MQRHIEEAATFVLRDKLRPPVAEQEVRILQSRSAPRKQCKELVIEMIVVRHGEDRARLVEICDAVVRSIVGRAIAHVAVALLDQKPCGVRTDRADGKLRSEE